MHSIRITVKILYYIYTSKLVRDKILNVLTTQKNNCDVMGLSANVTAVIILQYINA